MALLDVVSDARCFQGRKNPVNQTLNGEPWFGLIPVKSSVNVW